MAAFRYKYGDRPLEGYTIQRAAGRGGFGEVYYALSDSGREVALKMISGYEQIELRGVSQCMNLKSPHLVTIFDVRHNDEGVPFVIMEFVSGPSLRQLLDESPGGLGAQKTAFFLREIGKGLSYLHECGIVHRDLKPGNIFYENGYVKIGDYGLSKAIHASPHSTQTITVGTLHYMAPEIGGGHYDRSIDVYALGAVVYELLTGTPPYVGASPGEVLIKHMTGEPDLAAIEEPFRTVIRKAMAKDPKARYQSVQEMVEAVFGAQHIQESVSCFSPDTLSVVAQRVAQRVAVGGGSATPPPIPGSPTAATDLVDRMGAVMDRVSDRLGLAGERIAAAGDRVISRLGDRFGGSAGAGSMPADAARDPVSRKQRTILALITCGILGGIMGVFGPKTRDFPVFMFLVALASLGASVGAVLAHRRILPQLAGESGGIQRVALGGMSAIWGMLFGLPVFLIASSDSQRLLAGSVVPILIPLFLFDWKPLVSLDRRQRVMVDLAIPAVLIAMVMSFIFGGSAAVSMAIVAGTALATQILSPWDPAAANRRREVAVQRREQRQQERHEQAAATSAQPSHEMATQPMPPVATDSPAAAPVQFAPSLVQTGVPWTAPRVVPHGLRIFWLVCIPVFLTAGILVLTFTGLSSPLRLEELVMGVSTGTGLLALSIFSIVKAVQKTYRSWWTYLIKPLILFLLLETILVCALIMGNSRLRNEEILIGLFFIILPAVAFFMMLFVRLPQRVVIPPPLPGLSDAATPASMPQPSQLPVQTEWNVGRFLFGFIGGILLLAAILTGILTAFNWPHLVAAGYTDPQMIESFQRQMGPDWVGFLNRMFGLATYGTLFLSAVFLMLGRRWCGMTHVFRGLAGLLGIGISLWCLDRALGGNWPPAVEAGNPPTLAVLNQYLAQAGVAMLVIAAILFAFGLALLIWPAPRRDLSIHA